MNMNEEISKAARRISEINASLALLRKQRAELNTNPECCGAVTVRVFIENNPVDLKLSPTNRSSAKLARAKEMMALALVKEWDWMIDEAESNLRRETSYLVSAVTA